MQEDVLAKVSFIDKESRRVEITSDNVVASYPLNPIPDSLFETIAAAGDIAGSPLDKIKDLYRSTLMKAVICTVNISGPFGVNSATKIVRLTLTDEAIVERVDEIESQLLSLQGMPFEDTIDERFSIYRSMFLDESKVERFRFGAVEMYGDTTFRNLKIDPRTALHFFWRNPVEEISKSYQINSIAEIVWPDDPYYRFMRVMRQLFSSGYLDLGQQEYPCAYKFWVCEANEKSLASKLGFVPT